MRGILRLKLHCLKCERETPFVPVDPFSRRPCRSSGYNSPDIEHGLPHPAAGEESLFRCSTNPKDYIRKHAQRTSHLLTDTLPAQVYLHLMLRLPSLYFRRVVRVFQDAGASQPDIDSLLRACETSNHIRDRRARMSPIPQTINIRHHDHGLPLSKDLTTEHICPTPVGLQNSWESFTKSLLREWKTLNVASALLLSAILSLFQDPQVAYDPVTRTTALVSLTCALMSLSYGCLYMVRFEAMKSMYMAARWAQETQNNHTYFMEHVGTAGATRGMVGLVHDIFHCFHPCLRMALRIDNRSIHSSVTQPRSSDWPESAHFGPSLSGHHLFFVIVKTLQGFGRVNDATGWTETARETGDAIRGGRDVEREVERGDNRGRRRQRRRGKVNARETWKRTRKDDGHESEPELAPWTYGYNHDNRGSSSLDVITGPWCGLDGGTSASVSHERDAPSDLVREENRESGEENDHHCDDAASMQATGNVER